MRAQDTIAAIATPPGVGGIAILRLSGPEAERILTALCGRARWESHRLYYCRLRHAGRTLDEAMAVLMRAPRSYTRQDVAEIQCHGGEVVCRNVLEAALALGARPAQPGEFTRRAFENGRIDLAQAEAAMRLIGAQGEAAAREALRQMEGSVSRGVHAACDRLNAMLSEIAACTDFPDEIEEAPTARALCAQAKELAAALRAACDARRGRVLEQGLNVVLCGAPNVGKSSLLNALLGEARAIVTAQPGTTRDAVRGSLFLDGVRVHLTDTAGLRETEGEAEAIGVARAREAAEAADVLLLVLDGTRAPDARERELLAQTQRQARLVLLNKCDLPQAEGLPEGLAVSALTGEGIDALRDALRAMTVTTRQDGALLTQARHVEAAQRAAGFLDEMAGALEAGLPVDFAAVDAREALAALGEITGENAEEQIVDAVFRHFCVGK